MRKLVLIESEVMMSEEKDLDLLFDNNEVVNAGFWGRACSRLSTKNELLQAENKRLREALLEIAKIEPSPLFSYSSKDIDKICIIAEQALGE